MREKRAWAMCHSFPQTLDSLFESLADGSYIDLEERYDDIVHNEWLVPEQAQPGDYILHIISHGNEPAIDRMIEELHKYPDEWNFSDYRKLMDVLEKAKEEYPDYDGTLYCVTPIESISVDEKGSWAYFETIMIYDGEVDEYSPSLFPTYDKYIELTHSQTVELLSTTYDPEYNKELFNLNLDIVRDATDFDTYIQAFVINNSFEKSLDELLANMKYRGKLLVEELFEESYTSWTAPRWCKSGDIAFFMYGKTANATISRLRNEFYSTRSNYSKREQRLLSEGLQRGEDLYKRIGGCIFAFARVNGNNEYVKPERDSNAHWRNAIYAPMDNITALSHPIHIDTFRSFLEIARQKTISPVLGDAFEKLQHLICQNNTVPIFFTKLHSTPKPFKDMNESNWISYGKEVRRYVFREEGFRRYYVDFLLRQLGDRKTIYRECGCYKTAGNPPRVDNIIVFEGKYLPVEVKLSIYNEPDLPGQVRQYCHLRELDLGNGKMITNPDPQMYSNNVLIIDTDNIYLYEYDKHKIRWIFDLNELQDDSQILLLRSTISHEIGQ